MADEPRRLRKPDLSRVDPSSNVGHWQPPEKSTSYQYGRPGSGQYPDYLKPDARSHVLKPDLPSSQFPSSSLAGQGSQHRVKAYGPESAGDVHDDGGIRSGLTEARPRKPAEEKNAAPGCHFYNNNNNNNHFVALCPGLPS